MKHALHFPRFGKTLLAAALVAMAGTGCATDQPLLGKLGGVFGAPAQAKSVAAGKAIEGDITSTKALEFLYGEVRHNGRNKSGESTWDCAEWVPLDYQGRKVEGCKVLGDKYSEDGVEKYMLAMLSKFFVGSGEKMEENVIIHTVTLAKRDGQWNMESRKDFEKEDRDFMYKWELHATQGGADKKPGVLLLDADASGRGGVVYGLSAFMPYGNEVKEFAVGRSRKDGYTGETYTYLATCSIDGRYCPNRAWNGEAGGWDARPRWDAQSQGEYHDIVVTYEGFDENGKVMPQSKTQRWTVQNGKFVEAKAKKGGKKGAKKRK